MVNDIKRLHNLRRSLTVILFPLAGLALIFAMARFHQSPMDGLYIGNDQMVSLQQGTTWYHANHLVIKGKNVTLEQVPYFVEYGQIQPAAASMGGSYQYTGHIIRRRERYYLHLKLLLANYVAPPVELNPDVAKRYKNYQKWPFTEQVRRGIWQVVMPEPLDGQIMFDKNGAYFNGVRYKKVKGKG